MQGQAPRTFLDLQDEVLTWMADPEDQGTLRTLVKASLNAHHARRLTSARWPFMRQRPLTFDVTAGTQDYALHEAFLTPIYFRRQDTGRPLREIAQDNLLTYGPTYSSVEDGVVGSTAFVLDGTWPVRQQPGGTVGLSVTAASDPGKTLTVFGETADGPDEETITAGGTGTVLFTEITEVRKNGATWSGTALLKEGSTTLLTLSASQYGKHYRTLRFLREPQESYTVEYQFYRGPRRLVEDQDLSNIPAPFEQLLVYDVLLDHVGLTRATVDEQRNWRELREQLDFDLWATYQSGLSLESQPAYQSYTPRES
jgi:hypothetical protein